ncbi:FliA/WhiG family RNA polymerase sigma factor [Bacillus horti]|uniref:RNA polymerase sigma factor for flagellar operon FliA n=1 Tax=Caldalkalibacillus horti TaxID=77523 RepID=A0ABT9VUY0_9BACI|nr:FliA/WhiG family RNA polymerase sigma factor [Bacillus horti]MDQ0164689.1 RNA polymerase sigma factor for flagellar operon FliA [Bacillus horti]
MSLKKFSQEDYDNWRMWREDRDPEAGNRIVSKYLPLVEYVVHRLAISLPHSVHRDDLMSFGFNGLLDAIKKFDLDRGLQFETYASWRIRGAVIDGLRQSDWLPRSVRERARKIEEAYAILEQEKMRSVSDKEVAQFLDMTEEEVNQTIVETSLSTLGSIDEPIYDEENHQTERVNMILNERAELPEAHIHKQFIKDTLAQVINRLPEKEKIVISLFYFEELNLTEIADVLGLSTSRISQLHSKAMLRLKASMTRYEEMIRTI